MLPLESLLLWRKFKYKQGSDSEEPPSSTIESSWATVNSDGKGVLGRDGKIKKFWLAMLFTLAWELLEDFVVDIEPSEKNIDTNL